MKTLLILRHAKSSWNDSGMNDHERPLSKRGKDAAPKMGSLLRKQELLPDLILSSTALRAQATARLVAEESGYDGEILFSRNLYAAPAETYIEVLSALEDRYQSVMVVGHNPGLEELVQLLTGRYEALPTAALAQVNLAIHRWSELNDDIGGELIGVWRPKEI